MIVSRLAPLVLLFVLGGRIALAEELVSPAERAAHLLSASLQLKWASWSQRYPRVPPMDVRTCGPGCMRIDGVATELSAPARALNRLPDVEVVGLVRDATHPFLLLRSRREDPIYLWATYGVRERRLKFLGYDKVIEDLPADDFGDATAIMADLGSNLELFKYLTTRSASNLVAIRDEISTRLACDGDYPASLRTELESVRRRLNATAVVTARLAELSALVNLASRASLEGRDRGSSYCDPTRTRLWRENLLELRVLTELAIANVDPREFAPPQRSSSSMR